MYSAYRRNSIPVIGEIQKKSTKAIGLFLGGGGRPPIKLLASAPLPPPPTSAAYVYTGAYVPCAREAGAANFITSFTWKQGRELNNRARVESWCFYCSLQTYLIHSITMYKNGWQLSRPRPHGQKNSSPIPHSVVVLDIHIQNVDQGRVQEFWKGGGVGLYAPHANAEGTENKVGAQK